MSPRTPASSARAKRGRPAPIDGQPAAFAPAFARRPGLLVAAGVALVSLAALLWACRGAELGTPAADDYDYLHALRFEQPLDLLGPMHSLWYWRPLSRQAYYALFDPLFFTAPGVVAAAHVALLLVLYALAYRTARRWLGPPAATALAAFPLLAEPTRALVAWPTAAQPLLAMVFVTLALHEAAARRLATAGAALMTLGWSFWNRFDPDEAPVKGPVLGFNAEVSEPAVLMRPEAVEWYEMAFRVWSRDDHRAAEVALERARRAQAPVVAGFTAEIVRLQARLTFARGAYTEADSLNRLDREIGGESASYFAMRAMLALQAGDLAAAAGAVERCLALRPDDFEALAVAEALRAGVPRISPDRVDGDPGSRTGL